MHFPGFRKKKDEAESGSDNQKEPELADLIKKIQGGDDGKGAGSDLPEDSETEDEDTASAVIESAAPPEEEETEIPADEEENGGEENKIYPDSSGEEETEVPAEIEDDTDENADVTSESDFPADSYAEGRVAPVPDEIPEPVPAPATEVPQVEEEPVTEERFAAYPYDSPEKSPADIIEEAESSPVKAEETAEEEIVEVPEETAEVMPEEPSEEEEIPSTIRLIPSMEKAPEKAEEETGEETEGETPEVTSGESAEEEIPGEKPDDAEPAPPVTSGEDVRLKARVKEEKKKKSFLFLKKSVETIRMYDFGTDGPLVEPVLPEGYVHIDDYWIHEGRSKVVIAENKETRLNEYLLFEPPLSRFERELAERLYEDMRDVLILTDEEIVEDREHVLMEKMSELLHEYSVDLSDMALFKLQYYLLRNFLGWSRLDSLMVDPNIEDISCDGSGISIFLYHRTYRNIRTNVSFDEDTLYSLAILLAQRSGKHISVSQPMLDATLPDGSRLQLTLGKEVTSRGTSFTIRKFREEPFTPIELIEYKTFNVDQLVYFWLAIENNKSLLFVGGTASGKTTSLNAVSLFIPPLAKVVSIEDTREITLFHDNWIATVTRETVTETSGAKIDMFDLLKAAMRQRPEYILVGEVRGAEAQTLFQAMNTGHTTFSTLHANNVDAAIHRLENSPLDVPRNMVQALDIVSVQALVYRGQERVRRSMEIVEIAGIDPGTGNLRVNNVFEYDPVSDVHSYSGRSQVYSKIMDVRGWSREEMNEEIDKRRRIMQAMHDQRIIDYISVTKIFQAYAINPGYVIENIDDLTKAYL